MFHLQPSPHLFSLSQLRQAFLNGQAVLLEVFCRISQNPQQQGSLLRVILKARLHQALEGGAFQPGQQLFISSGNLLHHITATGVFISFI